MYRNALGAGAVRVYALCSNVLLLKLWRLLRRGRCELKPFEKTPAYPKGWLVLENLGYASL